VLPNLSIYQTIQLPNLLRKGFTLIELLVVISIIAILATIGSIAYANIQQKGRDAKRKSDLRDIKSALVLYYQDSKKYPGVTVTQYPSKNTASWIPGLSPDYFNSLPLDPKQTNTSPVNCSVDFDYCYILTSTPSIDSFILWAQLENVKDRQVNTSPDADCRATRAVGLSSKFNYCVPSPNL